MRVTRTYVDLPLTVGSDVALPEDVVGHLGRVLRLQAGDACILFNGDGHDYQAEILAMEKRSGTARVTEVTVAERESSLRVTLVQSIARGEKMDWILQKATELGVTSFVPVYSQRGEVKLDGARAAKRVEHWREVIISACEQSGRAFVPQVSAPVDLKSMQLDDGERIYLEPLAVKSLRDLPLTSTRNVTIAIGPEGGWSEQDLLTLDGLGFYGVRIGPRILRTETAGIATVAALQCLFGDF